MLLYIHIYIYTDFILLFFKQITIPFLKEFTLWLVPISVLIRLILPVALGVAFARLTVSFGLVALIFLSNRKLSSKSIGLATEIIVRAVSQ